MMTKEQFVAELLRQYPELKLKIGADGQEYIQGIRLKTPEELAKAIKGKKRT
jgi:hypothetical protein